MVATGQHFPLSPANGAGAGRSAARTRPRRASGEPVSPSMSVSGSNSLGVIFAMTLIVVAIVNALLRGLVSLIVIILLVTTVITWPSSTCGTTFSSSSAGSTSA